MSYLLHLYCPECGKTFEAEALQTICRDDASPLLARYDLNRIKAEVPRATMSAGPRGMWRWHPVLPVRDSANRLTLGEGDTPLLHAPRLGAALGLEQVYVKDESFNPTGTFKARGMAVAVARARELGVQELVAPTAGNAGGALDQAHRLT